MKTLLNLLVATLFFAGALAQAAGKTAGVPSIARDPYIGMIAVDAATGKALVEENADAAVFPASVIKLMNLFVVMDRVAQGAVHLTDPVEVTAEMANMGGSQVYLKEHEVFPVEDLIYALMVQSANDAAVALAIHTAGSQQAFVDLMNQKAQALGMAHTRFYSCHGEPPTPPRKMDEVDTSTPRDLAILGRALVTSHPEILRYTSTKVRPFRTAPKPFVMLNHNHLVGSVAGVDGLKTGWFRSAGYSMIVSAARNGRRVIVVVAGSSGPLGKVRDKAATECLARAFAALPPAPPPARPATNVVAAAATPRDPTAAPLPEAPPVAARPGHSNGRVVAIVAGVLVAGVLAAVGFMAWRRRAEDAALTLGGDTRRPPRVTPPLRR